MKSEWQLEGNQRRLFTRDTVSFSNLKLLFMIGEIDGTIAIDYHKIHKDQPKDFEPLAASARCPNAARPRTLFQKEPCLRFENVHSPKYHAIAEKGRRGPLSQIRDICEHFGLHELWAKIVKDPPSQPFRR